MVQTFPCMLSGPKKPKENLDRISFPESNKIGLAFFWIFYNFLEIF
jgi:hypothetical protein